MPEEAIVYFFPPFAGTEVHEILFDFFRVGVVGESESLGETADVGVNGDSLRVTKGMVGDDVRGFSADARECGEFRDGTGDFTAEVFTEASGRSDDVFCFGVVEAGGVDDPFDVCLLCGSEGLRVGVAGKEFVPEAVDGNVGGLGGEDGHDENLIRVFKFEKVPFVGGVRIHAV